MDMRPLGDAFIAMLRLLLDAIIFCSVVLGLIHARDTSQLGKLAIKALLYFEVMSTLAMALCFIVVNIFQPGVGLHATNLAFDSGVTKITTAASQFTAIGFFLSIIPNTLVDAFAKSKILQVLFISILTGAALSVGGGGQDSTILRVVAEGQHLLFRILGFIMRMAPIGAFGAMAAAVEAFGAATLIYLAKVVILYWVTSVFFVIEGLGLVTALIGLSIFKVLALIREELLLVLGTASGD
jgi:aerobic C4-dicarboxylate transport protein